MKWSKCLNASFQSLLPTETKGEGIGLNKVPGKRFPLYVDHGEARVQLQTQCTKTPMQQEVAREREREMWAKTQS